MKKVNILLFIIILFFIRNNKINFKEYFSNIISNPKKINIYYLNDGSGIGNQIRGFINIELINNIFDNNANLYSNDKKLFSNFDIKKIKYLKKLKKKALDLELILKSKKIEIIKNKLKNNTEFFFKGGFVCKDYKLLMNIDTNFKKKYKDYNDFCRKMILKYFSKPNIQMVNILNKIPSFRLGIRYRNFSDVKNHNIHKEFEENLKKYENIINQNLINKNELIFVTSDSKDFIKRLINKYNVFTVDFNLTKYSNILEKKDNWHTSQNNNNIYSNSMISWFIIKNKLELLISLNPTTFCQSAYMGSNIKNYITNNKNKYL